MTRKPLPSFSISSAHTAILESLVPKKVTETVQNADLATAIVECAQAGDTLVDFKAYTERNDNGERKYYIGINESHAIEYDTKEERDSDLAIAERSQINEKISPIDTLPAIKTMISIVGKAMAAGAKGGMDYFEANKLIGKNYFKDQDDFNKKLSFYNKFSEVAAALPEQKITESGEEKYDTLAHLSKVHKAIKAGAAGGTDYKDANKMIGSEDYFKDQDDFNKKLLAYYKVKKEVERTNTLDAVKESAGISPADIVKPTGGDKPTFKQEDFKAGMTVAPRQSYKDEAELTGKSGKVTKVEDDKITFTVGDKEFAMPPADLYIVAGGVTEAGGDMMEKYSALFAFVNNMFTLVDNDIDSKAGFEEANTTLEKELGIDEPYFKDQADYEAKFAAFTAMANSNKH